jgi:hypothetical protein
MRFPQAFEILAKEQRARGERAAVVRTTPSGSSAVDRRHPEQWHLSGGKKTLKHRDHHVAFIRKMRE